MDSRFLIVALFGFALGACEGKKEEKKPDEAPAAVKTEEPKAAEPSQAAPAVPPAEAASPAPHAETHAHEAETPKAPTEEHKGS